MIQPAPLELTLRNANGEYSVKLNDLNETLTDVIQYAIIPVLLAAGYHPNAIKEQFPDE